MIYHTRGIVWPYRWCNGCHAGLECGRSWAWASTGLSNHIVCPYRWCNGCRNGLKCGRSWAWASTGLWLDSPVEAQAHDLPHWRPARQPLHHRYGQTIWLDSLVEAQAHDLPHSRGLSNHIVWPYRWCNGCRAGFECGRSWAWASTGLSNHIVWPSITPPIWSDYLIRQFDIRSIQGYIRIYLVF
jgi:hypothetical protein